MHVRSAATLGKTMLKNATEQARRRCSAMPWERQQHQQQQPQTQRKQQQQPCRGSGINSSSNSISNAMPRVQSNKSNNTNSIRSHLGSH